jgi:hypothetical protein
MDKVELRCRLTSYPLAHRDNSHIKYVTVSSFSSVNKVSMLLRTFGIYPFSLAILVIVSQSALSTLPNSNLPLGLRWSSHQQYIPSIRHNYDLFPTATICHVLESPNC